MVKKQKKQKISLFPYMLLLPTLVACGVFSIYPFIKTIVSSFSITDQYGNWVKWAGTSYWEMMFTSKDFWPMLKVTFLFAIVNLVGTFSIAMLFALLSIKKSKIGKIYQMLYALPIAIASVVSSVIWNLIFRNNGGLMNQWLGTDIAWRSGKDTAFWVLSLITVWTHVSGSYIYLLAGFRGVSEDIQEAAIVDGANGFTRAIKIMIPMASPQIFYVMFINILSAFKTFTQIKLVTDGGPGRLTTTLMYDIYKRCIDYGEYEYACCLALVLFLLIFLVTRIQFWFEDKVVHYEQ